MPDKENLTIHTKEDYSRIADEFDTAAEGLISQARLERWPDERLNAVLTRNVLPGIRALQDPSSPVTSEIRRNQYLEAQDGAAEILDATEHRALYRDLKKQTKKLNAIHNVSYLPPPIIVVAELKDTEGTPMMFNHDAILIDKDFFEKNIDSIFLSSGLAHELAHRYQNSDELLLARLKEEKAGLRPSESDYALSRRMEAEADFSARRVSPKGYFKAFLSQTMRGDAVLIAHGMALNPTLSFSDFVKAYEAFAPEKQARLRAEAEALPPPVQESYFLKGIEATNDSYHPTMKDRLELQKALDQYPDVLKCRNVQFDGEANITSATECGRNHVNMMVNGVPTGARPR
ncbi:MAG: hypothetical protein SFW64_01845 [Alphaproteobacteria bacterium]|nr:hypothetical protein [Alphaproteobacteria bacterium]